MALLYETLNDREKRAVEKHLLTCLRCQMIVRKLSVVKKTMENEPKPAVEGTWAEEFAEARWEIAGKERTDGPFGSFFSRMNRSFALQAGLAAVAVILAVVFVFRSPSAERMTVVKAAGGVSVNNVSFFEKPGTVYDLGKKLELVVREGECVFQVGENTLIIAEKDTVLTMESGKTLKINLVKGNIVARVDLPVNGTRGKATDLTIATSRGNFTVTKAVFYMRSENDFTECGVKEGEIRTLAGEDSVKLNEMAKVTISGNGKQYVARMDGTEALFGKLDQYRSN